MSITDLSAYELAHMAQVYNPDSFESAGAKFLTGLRDDLVELIDECDECDRERIMDYFRTDRVDSYLIYTYDIWAVFVDLGAWQNENPFGNGDDMTENARYILYSIADELGSALLVEYEDDLDDEDDLEDEDD